MLLNIFYTVLYLTSMYSFIPYAIADDDAVSKVQPLVEELFSHAINCKSEFEESGKPVDLGICLRLFSGTVEDPLKPEYDICKCMASCISKKHGTMLQDGSAWNKTKIDEDIKILSASSDYKGMAGQFQIVRPTCLKYSGVDCDLAYKTVQCMLDISEHFRNLRDNIAAMF